jgi:hypothetical protein
MSSHEEIERLQERIVAELGFRLVDTGSNSMACR